MITPNLCHHRGELAPTGITTWNPNASTKPNQEPAQGIQVLPHMLSLPTIFGVLCSLDSSIPKRCTAASTLSRNYTFFRFCFMRRLFCTIPPIVLSMEMTPVCLLHEASKNISIDGWRISTLGACCRCWLSEDLCDAMIYHSDPSGWALYGRPEKYFIRLQTFQQRVASKQLWSVRWMEKY